MSNNTKSVDSITNISLTKQQQTELDRFYKLSFDEAKIEMADKVLSTIRAKGYVSMTAEEKQAMPLEEVYFMSAVFEFIIDGDKNDDIVVCNANGEMLLLMTRKWAGEHFKNGVWKGATK